MLSLDPIAHAYILTRVCVRSEDHLGGVGLNFTSEIIYLQPLDRSAAARDWVIYCPWSGSGSPDEGEDVLLCLLCLVGGLRLIIIRHFNNQQQ